MPLLCSFVLTSAGILLLLSGLSAMASSLSFVYASLGGQLAPLLAGQPREVVELLEQWGILIGLLGLAFNALQAVTGMGLIWRRWWGRLPALVVTSLWFVLWLLAGFFFAPLFGLLLAPGLLLLALLHPDGAEQFLDQPVPGNPGAFVERRVPGAAWAVAGGLLVVLSGLSIWRAQTTVPLAVDSVAEGLQRAQQQVQGEREAERAQPGAEGLRQGGFYTFTDDKGVTHAVDTLSKVPERYRDRVHKVE